MRVALHIDPRRRSRLVGIWAVLPGGETPVSFYAPDATEEEVGRAASWMAEGVGSASWDRHCQYLAGKVPYEVWWGYLDVDDTDDLAGLFDELAGEVVASAVDLDGATSGEWTVTMLSDAERLQHVGTDDPLLLARLIDAPVEPFRPRHQRLSSLLTYFADDDVLVVIAKRTGRAADGDLALAHGLAYRADRDLWLVLPREASRATIARLPWIVPPVRLWTYGDHDVGEDVVPARAEVWASYDDVLEDKVADLGERKSWIGSLQDWADAAPGLERAHRGQYLAWHCEGRGVLVVRKSRKGLRVVGGVAAKNPAPDRIPVTLELEGPMTAIEFHRVLAAVSLAAADRLAGLDNAHQEHRLQSMLTKADLGLTVMQREFPAWRPNDGRGFIDFLGLGRDGRVHIVETKIGPDDTLVLQGLDYWIWANAHRTQLQHHFDLPAPPRFVIDYVIADKATDSDPISPYTAAQAEALDGSIAWRFVDATGWRDRTPLKPLALRTIPPTARRAGGTPPRWARRLDTHLDGHADVNQWPRRYGRVLTDAHIGLIDAARPFHDNLAARGLLHRAVAHLRSSQAFALNLFAPLDDAGLRALWRNRLGVDVTDAEPPVFEYSDPNDDLCEATAESPHATQVDVLLRATDTAGQRHVALVEVKLSEEDFNHCSAYESERNPRREICRQDGWFGNDPDGCFQLANHDRGARRRYDTVLGAPTSSQGSVAGCTFRLGANQIMRNVALARVLVLRGEADHTVVALAAPEHHHSIWRRWAQTSGEFASLEDVSLRALPAAAVLQYHNLADAEALANRYGLDPTPARTRYACAAFQQSLDEAFPDGARYMAFSGAIDEHGEELHWIYDPRPLIVGLVETGDPIVSISGYPAGPLTFQVPALRIESLPAGGTTELELAELPDYRMLTTDLSGVDPEWITQRSRIQAPDDFTRP